MLYFPEDTAVRELTPRQTTRHYVLVTPSSTNGKVDVFWFSAGSTSERNRMITSTSGVTDFINDPWAIGYLNEQGVLQVCGPDPKLRAIVKLTAKWEEHLSKLARAHAS